MYLVLLMGLLEGYFVPLHCFHLTPTANEHKVNGPTYLFSLYSCFKMRLPGLTSTSSSTHVDTDALLQHCTMMFQAGVMYELIYNDLSVPIGKFVMLIRLAVRTH